MTTTQTTTSPLLAAVREYIDPTAAPMYPDPNSAHITIPGVAGAIVVTEESLYVDHEYRDSYLIGVYANADGWDGDSDSVVYVDVRRDVEHVMGIISFLVWQYPANLPAAGVDWFTWASGAVTGFEESTDCPDCEGSGTIVTYRNDYVEGTTVPTGERTCDRCAGKGSLTVL